MKKITVILSIILCLFILASCSGGEELGATATQITTETTTTETTTIAPLTTTEATTAKAITTAKPEPTAAEKSLSRLKAKMVKTIDYFAVAYVGFYDGDLNKIKSELKKAGITEKYPFIEEITEKDFYALEGNQVYIVVPADDAEVKLHECAFDENGELILIDELSSCDNERPFIIKGNISDSRPDFHIEAYIDDELMLSYNPLLSMEDGKLYDVNGILDFTSYDLLPFYG